ncbi:MAG: hypothetical protein WC179_00300 [Candidatus Cloacimonadaceae bacterium]|jgi:ABC-type lipoprotein export system ATPase subunit|nr:hypothetical protein [Candidatus Cloacimonadota bacterium]MDD5624804.1 hypothetical protein [Candidatus Cloacimonadota bacterium]
MLYQYFNEYLICNARSPLISEGLLREELMLYNISADKWELLTQEFTDITGKHLGSEDEIGILSGGQKVILMCLLALYSPAKKILFIDLWRSLDDRNRERIVKLLELYSKDKEIKQEIIVDET